MMKKYALPKMDSFVHGADYNPEQWKKYPSILEDDTRLLVEAKCNEWTVGIFSWAEIEKEEGLFDFSFLDDTFRRANSVGAKIILATPSGARPRWLAEKYEEVLRVNSRGEREHFGWRHNHCYTSPVYREKTRIINRLLAQRYGNDPALICWHISNEYGGECFCPLCQKAFIKFVREKYHNDIDELNDAWWTSFWSHTYSDFSQIEPPMEIGENSIHGLSLDWKRFVTRQTVDFMNNEIAAIKEVCPDIPVTTNMQYSFYGLDYNKFADSIDVASWDSYPDWHSGDDAKTAQENAFWHDFYRSIKKKPFLLMESTPSAVNWKAYNKPKAPGMDTLASIQAIGSGSDSVQYFQWRKSRGSAEKLHGAVVGHDSGSDTRTFRAVRSTGETLEKIAQIAGTITEAKAAIIYDWENMWALDAAQGYSIRKNYNETCYSYHRFFWNHGIACDIVPRDADLSRYKLVVAPMLYMTDNNTISNFEKYVSDGGTLFATYTLGTVNENDLCHLGGTPGGALKDIFGIISDEIDVLYPDEKKSVLYKCKQYEAYDFCESIRATTAKVLASYSDGYYKDTPALTVNEYGKGKAFYQAFRSNAELITDTLEDIAKELDLHRALPSIMGELPSRVSAHERTDGNTIYLFVENYSSSPAAPIELGFFAENMLTGENESVCSLDAYGFKIYKYQK